MTSSRPTPGVQGNRYSDGAPWEPIAGYRRAAKAGNFIAVSGTTAPSGADRFPGDTYGQVQAALGQIIQAVEAFGGSKFDIIRTRVLLVPGADVDDACRAHLEVLGDVAPANTLLFIHALIGPGLLVEIEADAVLGSGS